MTEQELIKQAFPDPGDLMVTIAYIQGMTKAAEEAGLDKEAFWGALARLGGAAIKGIGSLGSKVISGGSKVWNTAAKPLEKGFGRIGEGLVGKAYGSPKAVPGMLEKILPQSVSKHVAPYAQIAGRGMAKDMATFGLMGGGINAAIAPEGERGKAFLSGLAGGAAGGAAWRGASNLLGKGLRYTMANKNVLGGGKAANKLYELGNKSMLEKGVDMTERVKRLGAKTLNKAVPLAGALAASAFVPTGMADAPTPAAGPGAGQYNPYGQSAGGSNGSW